MWVGVRGNCLVEWLAGEREEGGGMEDAVQAHASICRYP